MERATVFCMRAALLFALIFLVHPPITQQELPPGSRRVSAVLESAADRRMSSPLLQLGISTSEGLRPSPVGSAGNVTMEKVGDSLARLEENMSSLIQSFLTVQRSVLNLEQLQELLVLLLEDILKQTDKADRNPMKDTNPTQGGADAGGGYRGDAAAKGSGGGGADVGVSGTGESDLGDTPLNNGSQDSDSSGTTSSENEDDVNDNEDGAFPDDKSNFGETPDPNSERVTGSNIFAIAQSHLTQEGMFGLAKDANAASSRQEIGTSQLAGKDDSGGGSSEGKNSNSNENYSKRRTTIQRSTHAADVPLSSSQKPQWSEPQMERTSMNSHPRFFDVFERIASRLGQNFVARKSSPRVLGLMQMNPAPHAKLPESTFQHPPIYQPLEIVQTNTKSSSSLREKRPISEIHPLDVKLHQEPVISHGGPRTGPEHSSSFYLEHPEIYHGIESTGERPTGMINNLMLQNASQNRTHTQQPDSPVFQADLPAFPLKPITPANLPDVRRKRHAHKFVKAKNSNLDVSSPVITNHSDNNIDSTSERSILQSTTLQSNIYILSTPETLTGRDSTTTEQLLINSTSLSADSNLSQEVTPSNLIKKHVDENKTGVQEYDTVIADLMNQLSSNLYQHKSERRQQHDTKNDDATRQVDSEFKKLIWISPEYNGHSQFSHIKTQATHKKTTGADSSAMPLRTDKTKQTLPIKTLNLGQSFPDTLHRYRKENRSSTDVISKIHGANVDTRVGDMSTKSSLNVAASRGTDNPETTSPRVSIVEGFVTETTSPRVSIVEGFVTETTSPRVSIVEGFVTETVPIEESGSRQQNGTRSMSTEWERLHQLIDGTDLPQTDRDWLIETLRVLFQNESVGEDLNHLNGNWRELLKRKPLSSELQSGIDNDNDHENDNEINNLSHLRQNDIYDDANLMSIGDRSTSSEEDSDEANEEFVRVRKGGFPYRGLRALSKIDTGIKGTNDRDDVSSDAKSDKDSHEDKSLKKSDSNEGTVTNFDVSGEGQDENNAVVKEIDNEWTQTADLVDIIVSTPPTNVKIQNHLRDPHSGLFDNQLPPTRSELNKGHTRVWEGNRQAMPDLNATREDTLNYTPSNRLKRQVNPPGDRSSLKSLTVSQQTHVHARRQTGIDASKHSIRKESITSLEPHQNTTQNQQSISQNSTQGLLERDTPKNDTYFRQHDLDSPTHKINHLDTNQSQLNHAGAYNAEHSNPLTPVQSSPGLESSNSPLIGSPNFFDPLAATNQHTESPGPSSAEPGETPSVETPSVMDLEEILSSLFMTYWHRFYNLYTRSASQTTPPADWEVEEEASDTSFTPSGFTEATSVPVELASNVTPADLATIEPADTNLTTPDGIAGQI